MDSERLFYSRKIEVQRNNLLHICRLSVKTLIDRACFEQLDENSEAVTNFCAIVEQVLNHRIRAIGTLFRSGTQSFWDVVKATCSSLKPTNCIKQIDNMEHLKTGRAKGRAWIRMILIEKRMSEYFSYILKQTYTLRQFYDAGSLMLNEVVSLLCKDFWGLNAIDFNFCLRGTGFNVGAVAEIDYTPYLTFQQCFESIVSDHNELQELNNTSTSSSLSDVDISENHSEDTSKKLVKLETMFKTACQQKGYLEELVKMRENQLEALTEQNDTLMTSHRERQLQFRNEKRELECVVLELQTQLHRAKQQYDRDRIEFDEHLVRRHIKGQSSRPDVPMMDMLEIKPRLRTHSDGVTPDEDGGGLWWDESDAQLLDSVGSDGLDRGPAHVKADQSSQDGHSLLSSNSSGAVRVDSVSMKPLTGSIASLEIHQNAGKTFKETIDSTLWSGQGRDLEVPEIAVEAIDVVAETKPEVTSTFEAPETESMSTLTTFEHSQEVTLLGDNNVANEPTGAVQEDDTMTSNGVALLEETNPPDSEPLNDAEDEEKSSELPAAVVSSHGKQVALSDEGIAEHGSSLSQERSEVTAYAETQELATDTTTSPQEMLLSDVTTSAETQELATDTKTSPQEMLLSEVTTSAETQELATDTQTSPDEA